jgi:hypothetical protein
MTPKSVRRFSEKIMLKQEAEADGDSGKSHPALAAMLSRDDALCANPTRHVCPDSPNLTQLVSENSGIRRHSKLHDFPGIVDADLNCS